MKKLMAIFAHPDDEGAIGGTLAQYAANGMEVSLICATRGEAGEISDAALANTQNLGQVRQAELEEACRILGIQNLEFLDYCDSGMKGTPENDNPKALIQADEQQVIRKIVAAIRRFRPDIVITFEPFGWYGHPDHVAISRLTTEAMAVVGSEHSYPDSGPAWQPRVFYYAVIPFSKFRHMVDAAIDAGIIEKNDFESNFDEHRPEMEVEDQVTHVLDVNYLLGLKQRAMAAHKTQFSEEHMFQKLPLEILQGSMGSEYFIQVYPPPAAEWVQKPQADLFESLSL